MTAERWEQVRKVFHMALELLPEERVGFLHDACANDHDLRHEVESLLAAEEGADHFLSEGAMKDAAKMLAGETCMSLVGKTLGHYRVLSLLGAGGMGEVYLAEDTKLKRKVALKLLPVELTANRDRLRRFEQEALATSALNHPNIITIHEIGKTDGGQAGKETLHFIAMEFVDGETLRERMRRLGAASGSGMSLPEVLGIAEQIAAALTAAHANGIVHRDLKPENVMLRRDGYVKILDFGLAKLTTQREAGPEDATLAQVKTGIVMGTVAYMSPEQARGLAVDTRTDIWSLGVVLYEMLTGESPFQASTTSDILVAVLEREPGLLSTAAHEVPAELQRIVSKTLQKDCEERYQTIKDLRIDLKNLARESEFAERDRKQSAARQVISQERSDVSRSPFDSLAVLPFTISGANADAEYLSDGITESVINGLAQLPQLKVMARSTVFRYKDQIRDPREIGRDLQVKAVLTGRIIPHGDTLILSAELVDVADGSQLWGEQYKRNLTDIFVIQEEISTEISEKLRLRLTGEQQQKLTRRYTDNAQAYQLYLKGRYWWNKRTIEAMKKAVPYFEQAIETDPCYALAYTGLGDCYAMLGIYSALPPNESFSKAKIAQQRALEIDDGLAEAHASLGFTLLYHDWNLPQAEKELRHAIRLNPGYPSAHQWLGFYLGLIHRTEEAIAEMNLAQQLDPFSASINYTAVWPLYWAHRYDEAIRLYRAAVELHPDFWATHYWLGLAYQEKGDLALAMAELEQARALGDSAWRLSGLGYAYAIAGKKSEAHEVLKELKELAKQEYVPAYHIAVVYVGLGECDESFNWLESAFEAREWLLMLLGVDPLFDSLRADRRFQDLLGRIGLSEVKAHEEKQAAAQVEGSRPASTARQIVVGGTEESAVRTAEVGAAPATKAEYVISEIKRHKRGIATAMAALVLIAAGLSYWLYRINDQSKQGMSARSLKMTRLTSTGRALNVAISPDGKYVAYSMDQDGQQSLWLSQVAVSSQNQIVPSAAVLYLGITFSRDGNLIYYVRQKQGEPGAGVLYQAPALGGGAERKLLVNVNSPVALSPDGKRLAFVRQYPANPGGDALIVANTDGTEEKVLLTRKLPNLLGRGGPSWSPDGEVIACGNQNYSGRFYSDVVGVRVADGVEAPITSQQWSVGSIGQVVWLATGDGLIVTASEQPGGLPQIWRLSTVRDEARQIVDDLNAYSDLSQTADSSTLASLRVDRLINIWVAPMGNTSSIKQITSGAGRQDGVFGLNWTPDDKIVYRSIAGSDGNIWIIGADGSGNKQLSSSRSNNNPAVTPDGRYLIWITDRTGTGVGQVWRMDIDGGNQKQLTSGQGVWFPQLSPDGKWVVYGRSGTESVYHQLWKVSIDGGDPVRLTEKPSWVPVVSPDGKLIVCNWLDEASGQWKIGILPFEGGQPTKVFDIPGIYNRQIRWTPDGRAVAFVRTQNGVSNIWAQPLDGGEPKQLTDFRDQWIVNFAWSRDGKQLALARGVINSDVVLISGFK